MKKWAWSVFGLLLVLTLAVGVRAQHGDHVYLGSAHVDGAVDHDVIKVGHHDGKFRAIQLTVDTGVVEFDRVLVHFGNGSREDLPVRETIPAGGRTRPIELPGDRRVIESVELWYRKAAWEHRPKVSLFGIR